MRVLDVRGEICPVPLVRCVNEIKKMKPGEVLKVISDHPPAKKSIPMEMEAQGHEYTIEENGAEFTITIVVKGK